MKSINSCKFFSILCLLSLVTNPSFAFTPASELEALLNFYTQAFVTVVWEDEATSGRLWDFVSTDVTDVSFNQTNPCGSNAEDSTWQGVTCTEPPASCRDDSLALCSIAALNLDSFNLTGPVNSDIDQLSQLTKLILGNNHLSGTLPPSLGNLTNLKV